MRRFLMLLPVVVMAQTPPAKAPPVAPKAAPAKAAAGNAGPAAGTTPGTARPAAKKSVASKSAVTTPKPTPMTLTTDDEKTIYALGLSMYRSLASFDLSPAELELIKRALVDATAGKPA